MPLLDGHPNVVMPVKAALAASIAWVVVQPIGGFIADYQYYAPLGAVVTVTPAVARGARSAMHAIFAIIAGGLLAIGVDNLPLPQPVGIAVAVAAGVACSYSKHLGSMGSWVPFVALFALVLHDHHPWNYVIAYVLLAGVGGLTGLLVAFLLPQVPTGPARRAGRRLSGELAHALAILAEAIRASTPLDEERRDGVRARLGDRSQELRDAVRHVQDARRANWRGRRAIGPAERLESHARSLQRLADEVAHTFEVADLTVMATTAEQPTTTEGRTVTERPTPSLQSATADALSRAAEALRAGPTGAPPRWSAQERSDLRRLCETLAGDSEQLENEPRLALVGIIAALQQLAGDHDQ